MLPLLPHQRDALSRNQDKRSVGLIMRMRLGKTLTAIRWASCLPGRTLIVTPLSVVPSWEQHLENDGEQNNYMYVRPDTFPLYLAFNHKWAITNWEGLARRNPDNPKRPRPTCVASFKWDTVILDESDRIKNPQAAVTKVVQRTLSRAKNKMILSGLPNPEGWLDVFEQMRFLFGSWLGCKTYWQFRHKFFVASGFGWFPRLGALKFIRDKMQEDCTVIRRNVVEMGTVLEEIRSRPLPKDVMEIYDNAIGGFSLPDLQTKWKTVVHTWLLQIAGGCCQRSEIPGHSVKVEMLRELLQGEFKKEQTVIWFLHVDEGNKIVDSLKWWHMKIRRIDGSVPLDERRQILADFQAGKIQHLAMQNACGRYGLDLSCARTGIVFSRSHSNATWQQMRERMSHPRKKRDVLMIKLLAKNTVDEAIDASLSGKGKVSDMIWKHLNERLHS